MPPRKSTCNVASAQPPAKKRRRTRNCNSKTRCLTCKNRRIKCDETKPACQRCTIANRECEWEAPPTKKLHRIDSKSNNHLLTRNIAPKTTSTSSSPNYLDTILANLRQVDTESRLQTANPAACPTTSIPHHPHPHPQASSGSEDGGFSMASKSDSWPSIGPPPSDFNSPKRQEEAEFRLSPQNTLALVQHAMHSPITVYPVMALESVLNNTESAADISSPQPQINDGDSGFSSDDDADSTTSVESFVRRGIHENGRRYHSYKAGKYVLPDDGFEEERLNYQHELFEMSFDGKLHLCPVDGNDLHRVLDVGTGTGTWAMEFADKFCEAEVIGVDLSPIQPIMVPPNLRFEVDDVELPWTFSNPFSLIHARGLCGAIEDWPRFFGECFKYLTPGGYIHLADMCFPVECDDSSMRDRSHFLQEWSDLIIQSSKINNRPMDSAQLHKTQLEAAGFEDVVEVKHKWPVNCWPEHPGSKEIGMWSSGVILMGVEAYSLALFTRVLGWTTERVGAFLADVRKEMMDPEIHAYFSMYVVYGKKPV